MIQNAFSYTWGGITEKLMMNQSMIKKELITCLLLLVAPICAFYGCMTAQLQTEDATAFKNRTRSIVNGDVTVTVAVPTIAEARAIYGVKLSRKFIQPVWVQVQNDSHNTYWLLSSGLDPDYFSPSEAAYAFQTDLQDTDRQLEDRFMELQFKSPVRPGSVEAGFVLVNLDEGFKAVDIDLISREQVRSFSFIIPDPDFKADYKMVDFDKIYTAGEIRTIQDDDELRRELEKLPPYTANKNGGQSGDPLNLVLIGDADNIVPALVRRGWHATEVIWSQALIRTFKSFIKGERYRYSPISALYVYGRRQDIGWQKARGTISKRNHMRLWLTPIRFRGKKVWVGQISRDIGVKLTFKSPTISTHVIDPDVDEARRYLVEDMAYSQALARIGYVRGVGGVTRAAPKFNLVGDPYYTDGLRAVLFFEPRPYNLSDIERLPWEKPSGYVGTATKD